MGNSISEDLRSRMAAMIRQDLATEASAGFPLLRRFPNSEMASVPGYFARLSQHDRDILLDALAHYSTIKWSHEVVREKQSHPVLRPYLARQPLYPQRDWYGERPKKSLLKRSVIDKLAKAGFVRVKHADWPADVVEFSHPDHSFAGRLLISFDPGLIRQLDFGFRDWLRADLAKHFEPQTPRDFIPIILSLSYDHLWDGRGTNNPVCWDLIAEQELDDVLGLLVEVLDRLAALAGRINGLAVETR
jgi:hypothetical protein